MTHSQFRPPSITLLLTLGLCCAADPTSADIILDEFTDSAMVTNSLSNTYIETLDVGPLGARRDIRIGSTGSSDPYGAFDINISDPGRLVARLDRVEIAGPITPITAIQFNYDFDPADVTEGGANDAILFDFISLTGDIQPSWLRAIVRDNTILGHSYEIRLRSLIPQDGSFTLAAPFEAFGFRGGGAGTPDATNLRRISFDFYFLGHSGELNWEARIERIRFGQADSLVVPEPCTGLIVVLALLVWRSVSFVSKGVLR